MKWLLPLTLAGAAVALGFQAAKPSPMMSPESMHQGSAATYENLATAIIAIRETENSLVQGILDHSFALAQHECEAAMGADSRAKAKHLEMAAREITNIASEGDKRVQAVRQRLLKAGHHHHTDAETQDDYMFINSAERKQLLDLATKVSKLGPNAMDDDIRGAMNDLEKTFTMAMKPE